MSKSIAEMFIKEAIKTENLNLADLIKRLGDEKTIRLLHAAMGMVTEAGEFMDALKKHIIYGKSLDEVNLKEELGDLNWYEAIAHNTLNSSFEEVMLANTKKLRKRYADKFSENEALNRDLDIERNELEREFEGTIATDKLLHNLTESVIDRVKMEIVDDDEETIKKESRIPLIIGNQKFIAIVNDEINNTGSYNAKIILVTNDDKEWNELIKK